MLQSKYTWTNKIKITIKLINQKTFLLFSFNENFARLYEVTWWTSVALLYSNLQFNCVLFVLSYNNEKKASHCIYRTMRTTKTNNGGRHWRKITYFVYIAFVHTCKKNIWLIYFYTHTLKHKTVQTDAHKMTWMQGDSSDSN